MSNKVAFDGDLRKEIKDTVKIIAKAVKGTLGPSGTNVGLLSTALNTPVVINDGATVMNSLKFEDPLKNFIHQTIKNVSQKTDDIIGDGSTTLITIVEGIILEGINYVETGASQVDIVRGIAIATKDVVLELDKHIISLKDNAEILKHVATISANNDPELGELIAETFTKVGVDGQIEVVNATDDGKTSVEIVQGQQYDTGSVSNMFNNTNKGDVQFETSKVLLYEGKLTDINSLVDTLKKLREQDIPLLIVADDFSEEVVEALTFNKLNHKFKLCAVRSPGFGTQKEAAMDDLSLLSGASIVSRRFGNTIEEFTEDQLGQATKITVTKDIFQIINTQAPEKDIKVRIESLKLDLKKETERNMKSEIQERIARLSNGVARLSVSGNSLIEINEKRLRIEDAINATRGSMEMGIVAGGGVALFNIANTIVIPKLRNKSEEAGYQILLSAIGRPIETILKNAGLKPDIILESISKNNQIGLIQNYGYDAKNRKYGNMIEMGIVDPVKVTKGALLGASSVSQMIISMNCVIY